MHATGCTFCVNTECILISQGTDLFDAVLHCQHFSEVDANFAMKQLSMALVYLHAHKIVHRDIKLENIFVSIYIHT